MFEDFAPYENCKAHHSSKIMPQGFVPLQRITFWGLVFFDYFHTPVSDDQSCHASCSVLGSGNLDAVKQVATLQGQRIPMQGWEQWPPARGKIRENTGNPDFQ